MDIVIADFRQVLAGNIQRRPVISVDYKKFAIKDRHFMQAGHPVFPLTYTWLPESPDLNRYFGDLNSVYLSPSFVEDAAGHVSTERLKAVAAQADGRIGQVFVNHRSIPDWLPIRLMSRRIQSWSRDSARQCPNPRSSGTA